MDIKEMRNYKKKNVNGIKNIENKLLLCRRLATELSDLLIVFVRISVAPVGTHP